jgi:hypothetical protein
VFPLVHPGLGAAGPSWTRRGWRLPRGCGASNCRRWPWPAQERRAKFSAMTPRTRPSSAEPSQSVVLSAEDEARLLAAVADSEKDEGRALTAEEIRHWAETGEWPES